MAQDLGLYAGASGALGIAEARALPTVADALRAAGFGAQSAESELPGWHPQRFQSCQQINHYYCINTKKTNQTRFEEVLVDANLAEPASEDAAAEEEKDEDKDAEHAPPPSIAALFPSAFPLNTTPRVDDSEGVADADVAEEAEGEDGTAADGAAAAATAAEEGSVEPEPEPEVVAEADAAVAASLPYARGLYLYSDARCNSVVPGATPNRHDDVEWRVYRDTLAVLASTVADPCDLPSLVSGSRLIPGTEVFFRVRVSQF